VATRSRAPIARDNEAVQPPTVGRVAEARSGIKNHRRFTLREVTLGGLPVGGATVDVWRAAGGAAQWSARLLMSSSHLLHEGVLAGTAVGGRRLRGRVHLADTAPGPRRGREVLAEFHGDEQLRVEDPVFDGGAAVRIVGPG
jgi:hypothetical protein